MRVNQNRFDRLKIEWQLKQMVSAYVAAEKYIIDENSKGNDPTGSENAIQYYTTTTAEFDPMTPDEFFAAEVDAFGNIRGIDKGEQILEKARKVRELLDKAIENNEFEKAKVYQRTLDILEEKYKNL